MNIGFVFKYKNRIGGGHFWRCLNFSSQLVKKNIVFFSYNILPKKNIDLLKNNKLIMLKLKVKNLKKMYYLK